MNDHMTDVVKKFKSLEDDEVFYRVACVMAKNDGRPPPVQPVANTDRTSIKRRGHSQEVKDEVYRLLDSGVTYAEVAERTGVSMPTIGVWNRARGGGAKRERGHSPAVKDRVNRLLDNGMMQKDIAAKTGIALSTIGRWKRERERQGMERLEAV